MNFILKSRIATLNIENCLFDLKWLPKLHDDYFRLIAYPVLNVNLVVQVFSSDELKTWEHLERLFST